MISAAVRENSMICSLHGGAGLATSHHGKTQKTPLDSERGLGSFSFV
jgi:hypothetical protein